MDKNYKKIGHAPDPPPVSKQDARLWFLTSGDLDLWPFQQKIGIGLSRALGMIVYANFDFSTFFVFELGACTNRRTDRQTDEQDA